MYMYVVLCRLAQSIQSRLIHQIYRGVGKGGGGAPPLFEKGGHSLPTFFSLTLSSPAAASVISCARTLYVCTLYMYIIMHITSHKYGAG